MANINILLNHLSRLGQMRQADKIRKNSPETVTKLMQTLNAIQSERQLRPLVEKLKETQTDYYGATAEKANLQVKDLKEQSDRMNKFLSDITKLPKDIPSTPEYVKSVKEGYVPDNPVVKSLFYMFKNNPDSRATIIRDLFKQMGVVMGGSTQAANVAARSRERSDRAKWQRLIESGKQKMNLLIEKAKLQGRTDTVKAFATAKANYILFQKKMDALSGATLVSQLRELLSVDQKGGKVDKYREYVEEKLRRKAELNQPIDQNDINDIDDVMSQTLFTVEQNLTKPPEKYKVESIGGFKLNVDNDGRILDKSGTPIQFDLSKFFPNSAGSDKAILTVEQIKSLKPEIKTAVINQLNERSK